MAELVASPGKSGGRNLNRLPVRVAYRLSRSCLFAHHVLHAHNNAPKSAITAIGNACARSRRFCSGFHYNDYLPR